MINRRDLLRLFGLVPAAAVLPALPSAPIDTSATGWRIEPASSTDSDELVYEAEGLNPRHPQMVMNVRLLASDFVAPVPQLSTRFVTNSIPGMDSLTLTDGSLTRIRKFNFLGGNLLSITNCWGIIRHDKSYLIDGLSRQEYTFQRFRTDRGGDMPAGSVVASESMILNYGNWMEDYEENL